MTIPDLGSDLIGVALRTAIVYVFLVLGLPAPRQARGRAAFHAGPRRPLGPLERGPERDGRRQQSLIGGLVAAAVILILDLALHAAADHWAPLRNALDGEPTVLVDHGRILVENLRREGISDRELAVALRQNQLLTADEALFVFLETSGQISVIPRRDDSRPEAASAGDDADISADAADATSTTTSTLDPANPVQQVVRRFLRRRHRRRGKLSGG